MMPNMREELLRTQTLSKQLLDSLQEELTYSSISFINNAVDSLKIIRKRLERGDCIILEETGEKLTLASYETFLNDRFSSYICSEATPRKAAMEKKKSISSWKPVRKGIRFSWLKTAKPIPMSGSPASASVSLWCT